jgi:4-hydroxy-2-oxoheptanedioate aldolase
MASELHDRIQRKKLLLGVGIESMNPANVELAGMLGFDLAWGDLEHGTGSPHQAELFCIAAKAGGTLPILRIPFAERPFIMLALEAGARLISIPMVESPETARRIVEFGKYKPTGNRGFAMSTRGLRYGIGDPAANIEWANRETHLFPQIETLTGFRRCKEIVDVEGISGGVIGPADLSISMGRPLMFDHPDVIEAVCSAIRQIRALGKIAVSVTGHPALAKASIEAGAQISVCATERGALRTSWTQVVKEMTALTSWRHSHKIADLPIAEKFG